MTSAYVLQSRPYRETSALLELFTPEHGRVGAVGRGARAPRSRLRGALQPFALLDIGLTGGGELKTLTHADVEALPPPLSAERVLYGWYLNELLLKLLARDDPHPLLFSAYVHALEAVSGAAADSALRRFEWRLLQEVGFGLAHLPEGEGQSWRWTAQGVWQRAVAAEGITRATLEALAADEATLDAAQCIAARRLLKPVLDQALGGRKLQSSVLMRQFRTRLPPA
ncbi:DNA repair protein RecO [Polycyclovorans algicola]|uniref:DNA repair protein RecO n=1 Tax=Polycyclovorans algicola TaxID=616992 RepID=UPI0004A75F83|nr:DNA repair protein RecO [Polycyclovorans algicola]